MSLSFEVCLVIVVLLLYTDSIIVLKLLANRLKKIGRQEDLIKQKKRLINVFLGERKRRQTKRFTDSYRQMKHSIILDQKQKQTIESALDINQYEKKNIKRLSSLFSLRRIEAAAELSLIASDKAREALEKAITKQKSYPIKLYMANALSDIGNEKSIPVLVATLMNAHRWYRDRVNMMIIDFGEAFHAYLPQIIHRNEAEVKELIVDFAAQSYTTTLKAYLIKVMDENEIEANREKYNTMDKLVRCCGNCTFGRISDEDGNRLCTYKGTVSPYYKCWRFKRLPVSIDGRISRQNLVYKAAETVAKLYPKVLMDEKYLNSKDVRIRQIAVKALSQFDADESLGRLVTYLYNEETSRTAINGILEVLEKRPELINKIVVFFYEEKDRKVKECLAEILSRKVEYFMMKLVSKDKDIAGSIIEQVLLAGKASNVIDFLNKNKNIDIENELVAIIKAVLSKDTSLRIELSRYLNDTTLKKCGLTRWKENEVPQSEIKNKNLIQVLSSVILVTVLFFPIIYILRYFPRLFDTPLIKQFKTYVIDFNYYLVFYSVAINLIYGMLLILSFINVRRQSKLWRLKGITMLFKKRMLPSISIIAPAHNEEKTIIQSANSLLNLIYPDYELIIVNDGSDDKTLEILIKHFDLKRVDYTFEYKLKTRPIQAVYLNPSMPKLIVVDKKNGGKADSLNAGINISSREYFCGIDADSLLEADALLKLASMELDAGVETPALGGNIFPANGCIIDQGTITDTRVPKNKLARFQTIEYMRAFMSGRLGWAYSNSLLIISGAFGLFRKERVISVGGYLTSSGQYEKDTVGEDMELVVRIGRMMREKGLRYKIDYAYNANCWTEVPEDLKSLKKQRYRWHRGLVDILTFHKKMIFNPAYGRTGCIAMPYFFIFEMVGPLIETQGYCMVIIALMLGLLNVEIALLLFISTVLMGVLISLFSLLIAEKDMKYFRLKDIGILIFYSILENFGPRQLFSFWRVKATLRMLTKIEGWDKAKRKGFTSSDTVVEG
ncbi:glycosyltransferase family 2 protein [Cellulosilyticum sp. I15G10I2]|uniref:glycosyltransferase family 2 protein n=1 Tax=Cellulosilyticum sp. I15G10I2 TaxID=1892843 RepID=UPI0009F1A174|nr:glycosyltransferase [Cellulosilyticum sp. I15G10I2]